MNLYNIHVTKRKTIIIYFCGNKIIGVPLSCSTLKIIMYNGINYIGVLERGNVWCISWKYGLHLGELCVVCQVETEIDCLKETLEKWEKATFTCFEED